MAKPKPKEVKATSPEIVSEAGHRAKDAAIVQRSQKLFEVFTKLGKYLATGLVAVAVIYFWYKTAQVKGLEEKETRAKAAEKDTGWYREETENLVEIRNLVLLPGESKTVLIPERYRFRISCTGEVEVQPYGSAETGHCDPRPEGKPDPLSDNIPTVGGNLDLKLTSLEVDGKTKVTVRRYPK